MWWKIRRASSSNSRRRKVISKNGCESLPQHHMRCTYLAGYSRTFRSVMIRTRTVKLLQRWDRDNDAEGLWWLSDSRFIDKYRAPFHLALSGAAIPASATSGFEMALEIKTKLLIFYGSNPILSSDSSYSSISISSWREDSYDHDQLRLHIHCINDN